MVIKMTLGFVTLACATLGLVCGGLGAAFCANAVHPAARAITTASPRTENQRADESADKKVEKRPNMRLLRRRLLLRAPRLLVCFSRESLGGQCLG